MLFLGLWIVIGVLVIFVLLFGPSYGEESFFRRSYILLTDTLWSVYLRKMLGCIFGNVITERIMYCGNAAMNEKHPGLQIMYILIMSIALGLFFAQPTTRESLYNANGRGGNPWIGSFQTLLVIPVSIWCCFYFFYRASVTDPGIIDESNQKTALRQYDFDGVIFFKDTECRTCKFEKPARSKHCSLCKSCIARQDHHCAWINNCVGLNNHKYFISFLVANTWLTCYGTFVLLAVFWDKAWNVQKLDTAIYTDPETGKRGKLSTFQIFQIYMFEERALAGLLIFAFLVAIVTLLFTVFHLVPLTFFGLTSNEYSKWCDVKEYFKNGGPAVKYERGGKTLVAKSFNDISNMYDYGSWFQNLSSFFRSPRHPLPLSLRKIKR